MESSLSPKTVLIVDDNFINLQILSRILKKSKCGIVSAQSGQQALEVVRESHPDLIILDVLMPEMSGFEVCRQLKSEPLTQNIPVIFMTALADMENRDRGLEIGGVEYIVKPIDLHQVRACVSKYVN
ncbi:MAG: response regulator [Oscillatoriales cyanobacterium RM1_1_9]|nr:response regulator [Oscillatoriales cyanobacterium SM2_3_0]NJO46735.1 response regulator [Oscillatoriales cyanobacterium RM2_1_1]NJO71256.1 response regulator [Oscillatoriales cyanobacterium RM1_1_9]